jgi:hypothetical protein
MKRWIFRKDDWVEVRSIDEIMSSLDDRAEYERLPFMAEMSRYAGRRFRVSAAAHKTCDTVHGTGGRSLASAVHLDELRCDGQAHGGCQARCLLFWKTAWLRPVSGPAPQAVQAADDDGPIGSATVGRLLAANAQDPGADKLTYRCQATRLYAATTPLQWWDLRQYWLDVRFGNVSAGHAARTLLLACVYNLRRLPIAYRLNLWLYDRLHRLLMHQADPHPRGVIPRGDSTPDVRLGLQPGEIVRIRAKHEIERTINTGNRNRGMAVDVEMTVYCGDTRKVVAKVERIINERTGEMMHFSNPCVVLDDVYCKGLYSRGRLLCPRRITSYWREAWLERVDGTAD